MYVCVCVCVCERYDLALNNLRELIRHKTQLTNQISWTFLSILADLNWTVVWIVTIILIFS